MRSQFEALGMHVQRWSATDGENVDIGSLLDSGVITAEALSRFLLPDDEKAFGIDLTLGAIGCAMSHMGVWEDILRRHEAHGGSDDAAYLVIEDDCRFLPGFSESAFTERIAEVPRDWQLVFLGGIDALGTQRLLQISPGVRRAYHGSRETTAYAITAVGARVALEVCKPLAWQLDTQLGRNVHVVGDTPELAYTAKPMTYLLWPPLVEQNKQDFRTDVQKDEHPLYLRGSSPSSLNRTWGVEPPPWPLPLSALGPVAGTQRKNSWSTGRGAVPGLDNSQLLDLESGLVDYAVVGSWNDWSTFHALVRDDHSGAAAYTAEVEVPHGDVIEFQLVRGGDWNQRIFPVEAGEIAFGTGEGAHGRNWKLLAPPKGDWNRLHLRWYPDGEGELQYSFGEPSHVALMRSYALIGSWNSWTKAVEFTRGAKGGTTFTAEVELLHEGTVEFQVLCDSDKCQRMFPALRGDAILGPSSAGHGNNWRISAPQGGALLQVIWDPVGQRSLRCSLSEPMAVSLFRAYALVGSWSDWVTLDELAREEGSTTFVCDVDVPAGRDIVFKLVCDGDLGRQIFPHNGEITGPGNGGSSASNWRLPAPAQPGTLRVRWDPTGRRSMVCSLGPLRRGTANS